MAGNDEEEENDAAFEARAMLAEWRPRLLASGLDETTVDMIAHAIAVTQPILEQCRWSRKEEVVFMVIDVQTLLSTGFIAYIVRESTGATVGVLVFALIYFVSPCVFIVLPRRYRRLARAEARTVLQRALLPPA